MHYVLDNSSDGDFYSSDKDQTLLVPIGDIKKPEKDDFVLLDFITKQKIFYVLKVNNMFQMNMKLHAWASG